MISLSAVASAVWNPELERWHPALIFNDKADKTWVSFWPNIRFDVFEDAAARAAAALADLEEAVAKVSQAWNITTLQVADIVQTGAFH